MSIVCVAKNIVFYSDADERAFFSWLRSLGSIEKIEGVGEEIRIHVDEAKLSASDLRELLALFYRYRIEMSQLAVFFNDSNRKWFAGNPDAYWFEQVFPSKALPYEGNKPAPNSVMLADVCGAIAEELAAWLESNRREDLASQVRRLMIPSQAIQGTAKTFSFMAYAIPRLTPEQRALLELRDWERIDAPVQQGLVTLDLDNFSQINWVHITDLPDAYSALAALQGYIESTT